MEAVGQVICDVCGQTCREIPRNLWAAGSGGGHTQCIAGKEAADIHLVIRRAFHVIVAVSRIEMPFWAEVMIEAGDAKIVAPWKRGCSAEGEDIQTVAARQSETSGSLIGWRHELPHGLHGRTYAQAPWIECCSRSGIGCSRNKRANGWSRGRIQRGCR